MIDVVMLMAGKASRLTVGDVPKPFLKINDEYLFEHALKENLKGSESVSKKIYLVSNDKYAFEEKTLARLRNRFEVELVILTRQTSSPLETFQEFLKLKTVSNVLVMDCDLAVDARNLFEKIERQDFSPTLCYFSSSNPNFSYLIKEKGYVVKLAEKKVISTMAIAGLYYFGSEINHLKFIDYLLKKFKKEVYFSDYVKLLIKNGVKFNAISVDNHRSFGTNQEYNNYLATLK